MDHCAAGSTLPDVSVGCTSVPTSAHWWRHRVDRGGRATEQFCGRTGATSSSTVNSCRLRRERDGASPPPRAHMPCQCCWTAEPIHPMLACDASLSTMWTLTLAGCVPRLTANACCQTSSPVILICRVRPVLRACPQSKSSHLQTAYQWLRRWRRHAAFTAADTARALQPYCMLLHRVPSHTDMLPACDQRCAPDRSLNPDTFILHSSGSADGDGTPPTPRRIRRALCSPTACCCSALSAILTCCQHATTAAPLPGVETLTRSDCLRAAAPMATARRLLRGGCGAHSTALLQADGPLCCRSPLSVPAKFTVRRASVLVHNPSVQHERRPHEVKTSGDGCITQARLAATPR